MLSSHAASEDGTPRVRSQFVDEVLALLEDVPDVAVPARGERCGVVGDGAAADVKVEGGTFQIGPLRARARTRARARAAVRPENLLPDGDEHVWSASSLRAWISCPVRWFVERVLRAEDLDARGEPLVRGLLAHAVLKDTLEALKGETGSAAITRASLASARGHLSAALDAREREFPLSSEPERALALRRRLHADLERYLEHEAARAEDADALEPSHLELEFGLEGDELPAVDLGGGLKLRGRIDRVDVNSHGEAVVYDYKGATAAPAAKWVRDGEVQVALYMRAVEELLQLRTAGGFYQPLSGDLRARGVLDADARVELPVVSTDRLVGADVRELLAHAVGAAREAAAQASRGELEPRPLTCSPRGGCAYPEICRCER